MPIGPGLLHTLVEAVSIAVEERLDASDQLLHQAIDVVAAYVATLPAAWCANVSLVPGMLAVLPDVSVTCFFGMLSATHVHICVICRHTPRRLNVRFKCHILLWNALTI